MLRKPGSKYEPRRTKSLLKIKPRYASECVITGYKPGKGKYEGLLGSFNCEWIPEGKKQKVKFSIAGMDDAVRASYKTSHPVGTQITFTYFGVTGGHKPRHPEYLRIRKGGPSCGMYAMRNLRITDFPPKGDAVWDSYDKVYAYMKLSFGTKRKPKKGEDLCDYLKSVEVPDVAS